MTSPIALAAPVVEGMMLIARRSRASQILMRKIKDALVVRVAVYGAHESVARFRTCHAKTFASGAKTIRGAARVGNNLVLRRDRRRRRSHRYKSSRLGLSPAR